MSLSLMEAGKLQASFSAFVKAAWSQVESTPLEWAWYLDVVCDHVQATVIPVEATSAVKIRGLQGCAVVGGKVYIRRLLINIPPRMAKSLIIGVLYPAWVWSRRPDCRILSTSYAADLSERDAGLTRALVESPWYRERWPHLSLTPDEGAKSRYSIECCRLADGSLVPVPKDHEIKISTKLRGRRFATSVGSRTLGEGGHIRIVDDPNDTKQREGAKARKNAANHVFQVLPTRTSGRPEEAVTVILQQRTHMEDCTGLALESKGWQHVCLPMEWDGTKRSSVLGVYDPRTVKGELLDPVRYPESEVALLKGMGPYVYSAQFQQNPTPASGGYFERKFVTFWLPKGAEQTPVRDKDGTEFRLVELPETMDELIQSWDASQKGAAQSVREGVAPDHSAGHVWARKGINCFLLDRDSRVMDVVELCAAIRRMRDRWPYAGAKLIEGKANGPAVMALLRDDVAGMVEINPIHSKETRVVEPVAEADKDTRALSMQGMWIAGNIILPHPKIAPWVLDLIEQLVGFPLFGQDDDVDAASQAIAWLGRNAVRFMARQQREAKLEDETREAANPQKALQKYIHERMRKKYSDRTAKLW